MVSEATITLDKPKLRTSLFFPFLRMIRAMNGPKLIQEFNRLSKRAAEEAKAAGDDPTAIAEAQNRMGMEFAALLIQYIPDAENEVLDFLAKFSGKTRKEIEDQDLFETFELVKELFRDPRFGDFLRSAAKGTTLSS